MKCLIILISLLSLLLFNNGCYTIINGKYSQCKEIPKKESPFLVYFEKDTIIQDTLFLNITIYNNSDSIQIINVHPLISYNILNDSSLKPGFQTSGGRVMDILYRFDKNNKQIIDCKNCLKYYSENLPYIGLKKNEFFTCKIKRHILKLSSKKPNYELLIRINWYIPNYLNSYCPRIWTGSIFSINKIKI